MCEEAHLVNKILEKGQKLRSKIIESIISNDPLCFETNIVSYGGLSSNNQGEIIESETVKAFLRGDELSRHDESHALQVLRNLSPKDLYKLTNRVFTSNNKKAPDILSPCKTVDYPNLNLLKYVDSLKVSVKTFNLTESGNKKINSNIYSNQTYFVEYEIPHLLRKSINKDNFIRLCSRRFNEVINFKQIHVHDIKPLNLQCLNKFEIVFHVTCRNLRQKVELGCAIFNFENFEYAKNFTCNLELPVKVNGVIIVGYLKVFMQLGCGHLYFGRELFNAIKDKKDVVVLSDDSQETKNIRKFSSKIREISKTPNIPTNPIILFGFIYISQARFDCFDQFSTFISCQSFCNEDVSYSRLIPNSCNPIYNFCQNVPLIYNDELLNKLRNNFLVVEFWKKTNNGNIVFGLTKLPLHQFYLAFRNDILVKYLSNKEFPVIGIDWWEPIYDLHTEDLIGQVQALVALGTEQQINNLKRERGFIEQIVKANFPTLRYNLKSKISPKIIQSKDVQGTIEKSKINKINVGTQNVIETKKVNIGIQSDLIMAEKQTENNENNELEQAQTNTNVELKKTSELLDSLQKALSVDPRTSAQSSKKVKDKENETFKAQVLVNSAMHLPSRKKCRSKKSKNRGRPDDGQPSTYVTFEIDNNIRITPVIAKNSNPEYKLNTIINIPVNYLWDNQKQLIFKVWRKSTNTVMVPNMQTDVVIGFAALDLTVLLAGLPNIQGWFHLINCSGKTNGQINIHVIPQEDLKKYKNQYCSIPNSTITSNDNEESVDESSELLGKALKRKFTELDEITQRLRLRLSKVTNDDSEQSNDELADEFEKDINTLCVEDDYDLVDFEQEAEKFNQKYQKSSENRGLLQADKQKINTLLEKLSIISGEGGNITGRYVSGCSTSQDDEGSAESILRDLDQHSRPNIHSVLSFNNMMAQLYGHISEERSKPDGSQKQTD